jgi:hypothetical protein
MKLKEKLKPEVLKALEECKINYSSSHRAIFASLNSVSFYGELTMYQINTINCFLPQKHKPQTDIGWMYGDNILDKKHRL